MHELWSVIKALFTLVLTVNAVGMVMYFASLIINHIKNRRKNKNENSNTNPNNGQQSLASILGDMLIYLGFAFVVIIFITFSFYVQGREDAKNNQSYLVYIEKTNSFEDEFGTYAFNGIDEEFCNCYAVVYENEESYFLSKIIDYGQLVEIDHNYLKIIPKEGVSLCYMENIKDIKSVLPLQ